ncbi:MAG: urease accessory protein UreD [Candidatus Competibacteraceae bacterium]|nr:urease accessory protein UreD [Candidatus Competibacteraceae bacterium]
MNPPASPAPLGWQARLQLQLALRRERTVVARRWHCGPLLIQRPFYPEPDGTAHLTLIHPPGGVVGGDGLALDLELTTDSRALITTPAAGKFYRSAGPRACQVQTLRVGDHAQLEWLPQETIVYRGAAVTTTTRIELSARARFMGWEITCLGRPAAGEDFGVGCWDQRLELWRGGRPLYLERGRFQGGSRLLAAPWGLGGRPVMATLLAITDQRTLVETARNALGDPERDELFGATWLEDGLLVIRYLGPGTLRVKGALLRVWNALRPVILDKSPCAPRIWFT